VGLRKRAGPARSSSKGLRPFRIDRSLEGLCSGEDDRALAAVMDLAGIGEPALQPLQDIQNSQNSDHRWWATAALGMIELPAAGPALLRSLSDADAGVRCCAAVGLREHPHPPAIPHLISALGGADRLLSRLCGDALVAHAPESLPGLTEAARASCTSIRMEAVRALSRMEDPIAIPVLLDALEDPSPQVHFWAETGLERLGVGMVFFKP
jgi:HEAT repeat protein